MSLISVILSLINYKMHKNRSRWFRVDESDKDNCGKQLRRLIERKEIIQRTRNEDAVGRV